MNKDMVAKELIKIAKSLISSNITVRTNNTTYYEINQKIKKGVFKIDGNLSFSDVQKSHMIEMILNRVPLRESMQGEENNDGSVSFYKGYLTYQAISDFVSGKFTLQNLHLLKDLDGKSFKELNNGQQNRIEDVVITTHILDYQSSPEEKDYIKNKI